MIKLQRSIVRGLRAAASAAEVYPYLQNAIELEHSTIPPYLTAMFSLKPGANDLIAGLIKSILIEEMLHFSIAGNILIAIGGRPQINTSRFVPSYPGHLPMSIGGPEFVVGIERFSKLLVQQIFMTIEEPENPIPVQTKVLGVEPEFATIGEFYAALQEKLKELGDSIFVVPASQQVLQWFDPQRLFPITDVASAVRGIDVIVVEGEGTKTEPYQQGKDPAHYYKFGEIFYGKRLTASASGFAYNGDAIPFDPAGVYPMKPNSKVADFAPGTQAHTRVAQYSASYSNLLNALHQAFNGRPDTIKRAIGLMYELKTQAVALMQTPLTDGSGLNAGPSYEYTQL
jgi:hypothetical protein